jgi:hypothetical protein
MFEAAIRRADEEERAALSVLHQEQVERGEAYRKAEDEASRKGTGRQEFEKRMKRYNAANEKWWDEVYEPQRDAIWATRAKAKEEAEAAFKVASDAAYARYGARNSILKTEWNTGKPFFLNWFDILDAVQTAIISTEVGALPEAELATVLSKSRNIFDRLNREVSHHGKDDPLTGRFISSFKALDRKSFSKVVSADCEPLWTAFEEARAAYCQALIDELNESEGAPESESESETADADFG